MADPLPAQFLTKGDNNSVDDRGLYAPGQLWLDRKVLVMLVLVLLVRVVVVLMVVVVLVVFMSFVFALALVMVVRVQLKACCLRTLWAAPEASSPMSASSPSS